MSTTNDATRKSAEAGPRAVGFRSPAHRSSQAASVKTAAATATKPSTSSHVPSASIPSLPAPVGTPNSRNAPPLKKRSKGSGFFGFLFLSVLLAVCYLVWSNFLRFQSYGVIGGRLISVAAPWDGRILNWQVRDGEIVQQGDVMAIISNLKMQHELAALGDDLKMSQANLDAEIAKINFTVQGHNERSQKATAEYLQAYGELVSEQAKFSDSERQLERAEQLLKSQNISKSEYEKLYFQSVGKGRKIEQLRAAVDVLKTRSEQTGLADDAGSSQLKPLLAKIARTQSEIVRLREKIDQGQLKAPVSGRITQRFCLTGESTDEGEPVLEILEDNSIEAVLYVPHAITDEFPVGGHVEIQIEPYTHSVTCTIKRLGDSFEPAPTSIARYYQSNQFLLPVYLAPHNEFDQTLAMRVQGTVRRPYEWRKSLSKGWDKLQELIQ